MLQDIKGKRITVVGAGVSGTAIALFASRLGASVFVSEAQETLANGVAERLEAQGVRWEVGGHSPKAFEADFLVVGSGIPPHAYCVEEAAKRGLPVIGELDFVAPHLRGKVIGITGSNGKSTVTAVTGHILKSVGLKTGVGGNLGEASSLFADQDLDFVVLELSSFQLHWATRLRNRVSMVTNLAPDHIDWHGSYEAYVAAKAKILTLREPDGWALIQDRDFAALGAHNQPNVIVLGWEEQPLNRSAGHLFMGKSAAFLRLEDKEHPLFRYADVALLGRHNLENIAMSMAAVHLLGVSAELPQSLEGFRPLPHRCELAGEVDGVLYVDDSKGTNVAASVTAMNSIEGRKVVILGGKGKGEDYTLLAEAVKKEADAAVVIGEERARILKALSDAGFTAAHEARGMEEAVSLSRSLARPGMVVLLSPACTSWDMYTDYKQRGEHFCSLVRKLEG